MTVWMERGGIANWIFDAGLSVGGMLWSRHSACGLLHQLVLGRCGVARICAPGTRGTVVRGLRQPLGRWVCPMFLAGRSCRLCALERELTPSDQLTACRRLFDFLCRFFLSVELFSKQAGAVFSGYHLGAEL